MRVENIELISCYISQISLNLIKINVPVNSFTNIIDSIIVLGTGYILLNDHDSIGLKTNSNKFSDFSFL